VVNPLFFGSPRGLLGEVSLGKKELVGSLKGKEKWTLNQALGEKGRLQLALEAFEKRRKGPVVFFSDEVFSFQHQPGKKKKFYHLWDGFEKK